MTQNVLAGEADDGSTREMTEITLKLEDEEGRDYIGRFNGVWLAADRDDEVYMAESGALVWYDRGAGKVSVVEDPEENLRDLLSPSGYCEVMAAIGVTPVIDLDF
jgi:hypothetical protein